MSASDAATASRNPVASWPSTTRWSAESESGSVGAATTVSPSTTGRTRTAPNPRIATCGGRTIGRGEASALGAEVGDGERRAADRLGREVPGAAGLGERGRSRAPSSTSVQRLRVVHDRHDESVVARDRDADVARVVVHDLVAVGVELALRIGNSSSARTAARTKNAVSVMSSPCSARTRGVRVEQWARVDLVEQRDVRDRAPGLGHVAGHRPADAAERLAPLARPRTPVPTAARRRPR